MLMIELSSILQQWASSSSSPKILAVLSSPLCLPWCLIILSSLSLYPHKPQDVPVILIHCLYKICISGLLCVTLLHWLWLQEYIWHDIWSRFCSLRVGGRQGMSYLQDCLLLYQNINVKEIWFWNSYLPTFLHNVMKYPICFLDGVP